MIRRVGMVLLIGFLQLQFEFFHPELQMATVSPVPAPAKHHTRKDDECAGRKKCRPPNHRLHMEAAGGRLIDASCRKPRHQKEKQSFGNAEQEKCHGEDFNFASKMSFHREVDAGSIVPAQAQLEHGPDFDSVKRPLSIG